MPFQITLLPSQRQFQSSAGETLLEAGLRQNINLPYGCRNGACGACKVQVLTGEVEHGKAMEHALSHAERQEGKTLLCCASTKSNLSIACKVVGGVDLIPAKTMPSRLQKMQRVAPDVMILYLKLPASERLQFHAGQYLDVLLKDGQRRSFSMANAPKDDEFVQLHVRHIPGGLFTDHVFSSMKERDILRINGPHGSFFLREDSQKPVVLLAGGTGFAPIKSIIEQSIATGSTRPMHLYWGARTQQDLYLNALALYWKNTYPHIHYTPVLSAVTESDKWHGRTGLVHYAVQEDLPDLSGYQVYACGAPIMIDTARKAFTTHCALADIDFFADAFSYAADVV